MVSSGRSHNYHFELPEFHYLDKIYHGGYLYSCEDHFFGIRIIFGNVNSNMHNIYNLYDILNSLSFIKNYDIFYHIETSTIVFECFGDSYCVKFPIQVLDIVDRKTKLKLVLRPDIKTFTTFRIGSQTLIIFDIDFSVLIDLVERILRYNNKQYQCFVDNSVVIK
jgi:hypothetical protein